MLVYFPVRLGVLFFQVAIVDTSQEIEVLTERLAEVELKIESQDATIAHLKELHDSSRGTIVEQAEEIRSLQRQRRESYRHRQRLEAALWGIVGFLIILALGYKTEYWNLDALVIKEIVGFAAIAASIYKVYQSQKER